MSPLQKDFFTPAYISGNTCLMRPGGCAKYWYDTLSKTQALPEEHEQSSNHSRNISHFGIGDGHCIATGKMTCQEYDTETRSMNFGPISRMFWLYRQHFILLNISTSNLNHSKEDHFIHVFPDKNGPHFIAPDVSAHVGLDVSLFGWLMPANPMVFSIFRNPIERLLSSFHYGITYGAGIPGQVGQCKFRKDWRQQVVEMRVLEATTNNSSAYQSLLREYLTNCEDATKNAYTKFLDPYTKNLSVAIYNLEKYVIVGLQHDVAGALNRFKNITLKSCKDHPSIFDINATLSRNIVSRGDTVVQSTRSATSKGSIKLLSPNVAEFDEDLQNLVKAYTVEDEVIYEHAVRLYKEQAGFGVYT
mmetsp:Transcript_45255/g.94928  ORF Transcript_45255/g.94928 Transcript_45255/m.94928 type:complete len:360 (+) Transcript_45255:3-1082(+)